MAETIGGPWPNTTYPRNWSGHFVPFTPTLEPQPQEWRGSWGWQCPACGVVYAPSIRRCDNLHDVPQPPTSTTSTQWTEGC
jgi:hypothetical protein